MQPLKVLVGIVVAASFAIWIYAFSGQARRPPPDELDSTRALLDARDAGEEDALEAGGLPVYGQRAEVLCAATIETLPNARDAQDGQERSAQLFEANESLMSMVNELRRMPVDTERDETLIKLWLDDWELYLFDRDAYAREIAIDEDAAFTLTDLGGAERLERRLTRFARTNLMLSCGTPSDVG